MIMATGTRCMPGNINTCSTPEVPLANVSSATILSSHSKRESLSSKPFLLGPITVHLCNSNLDNLHLQFKQNPNFCLDCSVSSVAHPQTLLRHWVVCGNCVKCWEQTNQPHLPDTSSASLQRGRETSVLGVTQTNILFRHQLYCFPHCCVQSWFCGFWQHVTSSAKKITQVQQTLLHLFTAHHLELFVHAGPRMSWNWEAQTANKYVTSSTLLHKTWWLLQCLSFLLWTHT